MFAIFVLLMIGRTAYGCDCVPPDFKEAYNRSNAAFIGEVISIDDQSIKIKVERAWKGVSASEIIIPKVRTLQKDGWTYTITWSSCDFPFQKGKRYLVYAKREGEGFYASACSGTYQLKSGTGELKHFGKGKKPEK